MIVAPGCLASSRTATSAVIAEGETISPRSSTTKQRSASPSKARPMSAPCSTTAACRSRGSPARSGWPRGWGTCRRARSRAGRGRSAGPRSTFGHRVAAHAVAGVDDDLQRADAGQVDQRAQVVGVARRAGRGSVTVPAGAAVGGTPGCDQPRISAEAGVLADRRGARPAQLDAVVLRRVVAGGEHRAGHVEAAAGEVEQVGRAEAASMTSAPWRGAAGERARPAAGRGRACRGGDDRRRRRCTRTKAAPTRLGDRLVELDQVRRPGRRTP